MGRISWNDEKTRKLLSILAEEKDKGTSKYSWPSVAKVFNAQTGEDISAKQAHNHFSDLKDKYKSYEELQRLTGIAYNPTTGAVDIQEKSLERWNAYLEKNGKYGLALAKKELANIDLLRKLFDGQTAHGVGGCFSPAMAKTQSYLTKNVEDLTLDKEGSGDNEIELIGDDDILFPSSAAESQSPPKSVIRKVSRSTSSKRKSEEIMNSAELKRRQTSFDTVIELLSSSGIGSSSGSSKAQRVSDALEKIGVSEERGDGYFVSAIKYFSDEKHADSFLTLRNDNQKWIYLKELDVDHIYD